MAKTDFDKKAYIQLCKGLQSRREIIGKIQPDIAKDIGIENTNQISSIEAGKLPITAEKILAVARSYALDEDKVALAYFYTRYPDIFNIIMKIVEKQPTITEKSRAKIEEEVKEFIRKIPRMSVRQTG